MAGVEVRIGADSSELERAVSRSRSSLRKLSTQMRSNITTMAKYSAAATAAGAAIGIGLTVKGLAAVDAQAKLATNLNTTSASMATIRRAGDLAGVSIEKINASATRLTRRLSLAEAGTGPAAAAIERLGINIQEVSEMPIDERIAFINTQISELIPIAEQAGMATQFFGEEAGIAMRALDAEVLAQARKEARAFGTAVSEIDAERVQAANDSFSRFGTILEGVQTRLAVMVAGPLNTLSDYIVDAITETEALNAEAENMGKAFSDGLADALEATGSFIGFFESNPAVGEFGIIGLVMFGRKGAAIGAVIGAVFDGVRDEMRRFGVGVNDEAAELERMESRLQGLNEALERRRSSAGVPGQSDDRVQQNLQRQINVLQARAEELRATMGPDAWTDFNKFFADGVEQTGSIASFLQGAADALRDAQDTVQEGREGSGTDSGDSGGGGGVGQAVRDQIEARLEAIREAHMTERELQQEKYQSDLELLAQSRENELVTQQEYDELVRQSAQGHQDALTEIEKDAAEARKKVAEDEQRAKFDAMSSAFSNLSTLMNTESRKLFEIGKVAAIANAVVSAHESMVEAYKGGLKVSGGNPAVGAAFAAAAGAATFAQVQAIRSQSFGSGGGGGSGGMSNTQSVNAASTPVQTDPGRDVRFTLALEGASDRDRAFAGSILERINDEIERGGRISSVGIAN